MITSWQWIDQTRGFVRFALGGVRETGNYPIIPFLLFSCFDDDDVGYQDSRLLLFFGYRLSGGELCLKLYPQNGQYWCPIQINCFLSKQFVLIFFFNIIIICFQFISGYRLSYVPFLQAERCVAVSLSYDSADDDEGRNHRKKFWSNKFIVLAAHAYVKSFSLNFVFATLSQYNTNIIEYKMSTTYC